MASNKLEQDTLLYIERPFNCWSDWTTKNIEEFLIVFKGSYVFDIMLGQVWLFFFSEKTFHSSCNDLCLKRASGHTANHIRDGPVNTGHFDSVTWFQLIDEVILQDNIYWARKLAWWSTLWHFLDSNCLGIFVETESILCWEWIVICILCWEGVIADNLVFFVTHLR